jgi:hypothetical protein
MVLANTTRPAYWRWFVVAVAALLAACQSATLTPSFAPVPAPALAIGDHWQYQITDNLRLGLVTMLDVQVVNISGGTASLRLIYSNQYGRTETTEEIDANGGLAVGALKGQESRRFPSPVKLFDFPLQNGKTWRQTIDTFSPETQLAAQILVYGAVNGQSVVTVPAGAFEATFVYRIIQLDDEQFWRTRTNRRDSVWFASAVKGTVREIRDASYVQIGGGIGTLIRTENTTRELITFQPGVIK